MHVGTYMGLPEAFNHDSPRCLHDLQSESVRRAWCGCWSARLWPDRMQGFRAGPHAPQTPKYRKQVESVSDWCFDNIALYGISQFGSDWFVKRLCHLYPECHRLLLYS